MREEEEVRREREKMSKRNWSDIEEACESRQRSIENAIQLRWVARLQQELVILFTEILGGGEVEIKHKN